MSDRAAPFKFTTNIPVKAEIRFIDVRPGKWHEGKKLPPQVSLKGTFDGVDTIAFLPGPAWKNVKALADNGVIDAQGQDVGLQAANDEGLEAAVSIPVAVKSVTATLTKLAGDKYDQMRYVTGNAPPSKRLTHAEATQPKGSYIPGIDGPEAPIPEDVGYGVDSHEHFPSHQANTRVPSAEAQRTAPNAAKRAAIVDDYLALLAHVGKAVPNFSDDAVQAAAATIFIQWKNAGLV